MATSIHDFNLELYAEHLDEAAFVYEQRLAYADDPEVDWPALAAWDDRLEAHLDALVVGGRAALDVCLGRVPEAEPGIVHATLRLLCRQDRLSDALSLIGGIDPSASPTLSGAAAALSADLPAAWTNEIVAELDRVPTHRAVYARVLGYRRVSAQAALLKSLARPATSGLADVAWALGRVGTHQASEALRWLVTNSEDAREAAALALLRLGEEWPVTTLVESADDSAWAARVLAVGGTRSATVGLRDTLQAADPDPDIIVAVGLLGELTTVRPLLELLGHGDPARSGAAAVALNSITGAALHGPVFVPDPIDVDALTDEERLRYEQDGSLPDESRRQGDWVRMPLADARRWRAWLEEHRGQFRAGLRWRMGAPYGPAALVDFIEAPTTPHALRALAYDELVARYRLDVPFEADLSVARQRGCLARMRQWAVRQRPEFEEGLWYFAGVPRS